MRNNAQHFFSTVTSIVPVVHETLSSMAYSSVHITHIRTIMIENTLLNTSAMNNSKVNTYNDETGACIWSHN